MATPPPEPCEASGPDIGAVRQNMKVLSTVAIAFWGLAVVFAILPTRDPVPQLERTVVPLTDIDPSPRFKPMGDDAMALVSVYERNCMECHATLVSSDTPRTDVNNYHDTIHMDHGLNGRCVNCHDLKDRNRLVMRDGETIGFSQSSTLCSNCHGPAYRQWERGVHGKTLDFWDPEQGDPRRLQCVECHDPHSPHYNQMVPLPGPNTLRMGDQNPAGNDHGGGVTSPLMRGLNHESDGSNHGKAKE